MEYIITTTNGELYHHGILGQKWGVRRYQNEDGTWTDAGKKRYGDDDGNTNSKKSDKSSPKINIHLSDKAKRNLKIAGAVVGTAAVTAGAIYLAKQNKKAIDLLKQADMSKAKEFLDRAKMLEAESEQFSKFADTVANKKDNAVIRKEFINTVKNSTHYDGYDTNDRIKAIGNLVGTSKIDVGRQELARNLNVGAAGRSANANMMRNNAAALAKKSISGKYSISEKKNALEYLKQMKDDELSKKLLESLL